MRIVKPPAFYSLMNKRKTNTGSGISKRWRHDDLQRDNMNDERLGIYRIKSTRCLQLVVCASCKRELF